MAPVPRYAWCHSFHWKIPQEETLQWWKLCPLDQKLQGNFFCHTDRIKHCTSNYDVIIKAKITWSLTNLIPHGEYLTMSHVYIFSHGAVSEIERCKVFWFFRDGVCTTWHMTSYFIIINSDRRRCTYGQSFVSIGPTVANKKKKFITYRIKHCTCRIMTS